MTFTCLLNFCTLLLFFINLFSAAPAGKPFLGLSNELFQGDMMLRPQNRNGRKGENFRWPKGVITYFFDPTFTAGEKFILLEAMAEVSSKSCVQFKERTNELDYVNIVKGPKGSGCNSWVGKLGGVQNMNLEEGCVTQVGPPIHELMHAVGFHHEHSRLDRDEFVKVLWENIGKDMAFSFNKEDGLTWGLPYDYLSIMQYPAWAFSMFAGKNAIEPMPDPNARFGPYDHLSALDGQKINKMYEGICQ